MTKNCRILPANDVEALFDVGPSYVVKHEGLERGLKVLQEADVDGGPIGQVERG